MQQSTKQTFLKMEAVSAHITQNNKRTYIFDSPSAPSAILALPRRRSALFKRTFQALYLLHKALHSGRRHVTFCCSRQLNRTLLLSRLTRPWSYFRLSHTSRAAALSTDSIDKSTGHTVEGGTPAVQTCQHQ